MIFMILMWIKMIFQALTMTVIGHQHQYFVDGIIMIWVNYNDLTATSLESWLIREIIPKWP